MRVLVVEDHRNTAAFVREALQAEGFAVDACGNGGDALAAAMATPFDAVVLDIMLPGRDGLSVLRQLRADANHVKLAIASTGPDIPPEMLGWVFDRFFRANPNHGSATEGCGLGLSIAQWIVSAHNGTIKIESMPQQLTTVTVRLPLLQERKPS